MKIILLLKKVKILIKRSKRKNMSVVRTPINVHFCHIFLWNTSKTRRYFIYSSGTKDTKQFIYQNPFGINFRYRHQVYDTNNQIHVTIYLDRTRATNFSPDRKFAWYLALSGVNTALASGHFQNYGVVQPGLYFWRLLSI